MHSATHRLNHDFQLTHFLATSCHTPDHAYALLYAQMIDMQGKIAHHKAQVLRREVSRMKAQAVLDDPRATGVKKLEARADLAEQDASAYVFEMNAKGAEAELAHINRLMAELEPQRKYSHLPILEANEAAQRDEWRLELCRRAENYLLANMTGIPHDQIDTMRMHPDFATHILPHIMQFGGALRQCNGDLPAVLAQHAAPLLLKGSD